ncbi:MAG: M20 family peptidase [Planctomycetota bacterium]|nr:MAG: M20 family peptidase [Planctomycetota bacterium]
MPLSQAERKVCALIESRESALLEDLKLHVETPTGGFNMPALDETRGRLASRLEALGAQTTLIPGESKPDWLLGSSPETGPPPTAVCARLRPGRTRILIAGHLDTVHDPKSDFRELSISADGKTATGPGCVDMKGGLVIAVAALEALEEAGLEASWSFLMNSDEETGSYHSLSALRSEAGKHDVGLAIEPALPGGELAIERMGAGQFMLEAHGRSAHVGRAFTEGVSAVTALARAIVAVSEMPDPQAGRILNIGPLQGGTAVNAVPDLARAWGNVRYPTEAVGEEIGAMLDALATAPDAMPSLTVRRSFNRPAKPLTPEVEKLALKARRVAEDLGQKLPFARTGGVCDGNILQDAGLTTIDTLGVRGGGLHTPNEWIELPSIVERCKLLAVLIHRLTVGGLEGSNDPV